MLYLNPWIRLSPNVSGPESGGIDERLTFDESLTCFNSCNLVKSVYNSFFEGAVWDDSGSGSVRQDGESEADFEGVRYTVAWNPESSLKIVCPDERAKLLDSILILKSR